MKIILFLLIIIYIYTLFKRHIQSPFWSIQPMDMFIYSPYTYFHILYKSYVYTPFQPLIDKPTDKMYTYYNSLVETKQINQIEQSYIHSYIDCLNKHYVEYHDWTHTISYELLSSCFSYLTYHKTQQGGFVSIPIDCIEPNGKHRLWNVDMFCIHPNYRGLYNATNYIETFVIHMMKHYTYKQFVFKREHKPLNNIIPHIQYTSMLYDCSLWNKTNYKIKPRLIKDIRQIHTLFYKQLADYIPYVCIPRIDILYNWIQHKRVWCIQYKSSYFIFRYEHVQYKQSNVITFIGGLIKDTITINEFKTIVSASPISFRYLWDETHYDILETTHSIYNIPIYYYFYNMWIGTNIPSNKCFILI